MSSRNPSTSTSEPTVIPGPPEGVLLSSEAMTVKVSLTIMKQQLAARRKYLVKTRRNELNTAARARKKGEDQSGQVWSKMATLTLTEIRKIDAQIGLLSEAQNKVMWNFRVDLRDPDLIELGFGMDENGTYPAL